MRHAHHHGCVHDRAVARAARRRRLAVPADVLAEAGMSPDGETLLTAEDYSRMTMRAAASGTAGNKRQQEKDPGMYAPDDGEFHPLRIKFDTRMLEAEDGFCSKVGQFARIGNPPQGGAMNTPECDESCELETNVPNSSKTCACWYRCRAEDVLTPEKRTYLLDKLLEPARAFFEGTLMVRKAPITLDVPCDCGDDEIIVSNAEYAGTRDADLVVFVISHTNRFENGRTLAYACPCDSDPYGRPAFGIINVAPDQLHVGRPELLTQDRTIVLHELTHVLGFSRLKFDSFLNTTAALPPWTSFDTYGGDVERPRLAPIAVYKDVVAKADVMGQGELEEGVTKIITPQVVAATRAYYGCDTLDGLELESSGGVGSASSHWEKRILNNEYMTASISYQGFVSNMTMALLVDSGWYRLASGNVGNDAGLVQEQMNKWMDGELPPASLSFGRGEGCDFVDPRCDKWKEGKYLCSLDERSEWGCTWDGTARGRCNIIEYSRDVPAFYRYFASPKLGGASLLDYCPIFDHTMGFDCRQPIYQNIESGMVGTGSAGEGDDSTTDIENMEGDQGTSSLLLARGEVFGYNARCLQSTLQSTRENENLVDARGNPDPFVGDAGCHDLRCTAMNDLVVRVRYTWQACGGPGQDVSHPSYKGRVQCPPTQEAMDVLCAQVPVIELGSLPTVSGVDPADGSLGPGFQITVTGSNLENVVEIVVGGERCKNVEATSTSAVCTFAEGESKALPSFGLDGPSHGTLNVAVVASDGLSAEKADAFERTSHGAFGAALGVLIGSIVLVLCLAVVAGVVVFWFLKRRKQQQQLGDREAVDAGLRSSRSRRNSQSEDANTSPLMMGQDEGAAVQHQEAASQRVGSMNFGNGVALHALDASGGSVTTDETYAPAPTDPRASMHPQTTDPRSSAHVALPDSRTSSYAPAPARADLLTQAEGEYLPAPSAISRRDSDADDLPNSRDGNVGATPSGLGESRGGGGVDAAMPMESGDLSEYLTQQCPWFDGTLSRREAEDMVRAKGSGEFVGRTSSNGMNTFAVTHFDETHGVGHLVVYSFRMPSGIVVFSKDSVLTYPHDKITMLLGQLGFPTNCTCGWVKT